MNKDRAEDFDNFEMEPSQGVWKKIEEKLPVRKNRRWFLFWIVSGVFLIAGALYFPGKINSLSISENNDKRIVSSAEENRNIDLNKNKNSEIVPAASAKSINEEKLPVINEQVKKKATKNGNSLIVSASNGKFNSDALKTAVHNQSKENQNEKQATSIDNAGISIRSGNILPEEASTINKKNYFLEEGVLVNDVMRKKSDPEIKEKSLSRWSVFAGGGIIYTKDFILNSDVDKQENENVKGITKGMFGAGIGYDINPRLKISFGISKNVIGLERSSSTEIILHGAPGDPAKTYSFLSPTGNLSGSGIEFDQAYFNSADTSVFPHIQQATVFNDSTKTIALNLREEYHYIQFPLTLTYKFIERKITPFAGLTFASSCLLKNEILVNDTRLYFENASKPVKYLFSTGLTIGTDIYITRRISFFVDGFYMKGLNSIITGDNKWIPDYYGLNGGLSYRL